jgi:hypothetical protein
MSTARAAVGVSVVSGVVYAIGGYDGSYNVKTCEAYTAATNSWAPVASMTRERGALGTCAVGGMIYAVGGFANSGNASDPATSVEKYDPTADVWTPAASMSTPRSRLAVGELDGIVYAIGGWDGFNILSSVEAYDVATDRWATISPMHSPRQNLGVGVLGGKIYAVGGQSDRYRLASVEMYDPTADTWTMVTQMSMVRAWVGVGVLKNKLYAIGGWNGSIAIVPWATITAEVYTPPPPPPTPPTLPPTLPPQPPTPPTPLPVKGKGKSAEVGVVVGGVLAVGALALFLARKKRKTGGGASGTGGAEKQQMDLTQPLLYVTAAQRADDAQGRTETVEVTALRHSLEPQEFTEAQMAAATGGFRNPIDEGAFGFVYRGRLGSSDEVAIKVLKPNAAAAAAGVAERAQQFVGAGSFRKELEVLGKYRHRNLVELLGFCLSDDAAAKQCLVFEWMAGGSLKKRLAPDSAAPALTAQQRFDIASDVARGLEYLHVKADPPIIHQDVKSDNILLCVVEGQLLAKVADFGTARYAPALLTTGVSKVETQTIIGTKPYMPPEYHSGQVSEKTDTFAFGVVLLELLTGMPPANRSSNEFLYAELSPVVEEAHAQLPPLLDLRAGKWPKKKALALVALAKRCLEMMAVKRCVVAGVLSGLDEIAGRMAVKRAGRGEEYDPMTGKLVKTTKK